MKKVFLFLVTAFLLLPLGMNAQMMPTVSTSTTVGEGSEHWYYIYFQRYSKAIEYKGDGQPVMVEDPVEGSDAQLWKIVEVATDEYRIVNKATGAQMYKSGSHYNASTSESSTYKVFPGTNTDYYPLPLLIEDTANSGTYFNVVNNNNTGNIWKISEWNSQSDNGNALQFFTYEQIQNPPLPAPDLPDGLVLSKDQDETWYYVKSIRAGLDKTLQTGEDATTQTRFKTIEKDNDSQLWKIIESSGAYQLVSKDGKYLVYDAQEFYAKDAIDSNNKPYVFETHTGGENYFQGRMYSSLNEYFDCANNTFELGTWNSTAAKNSAGAAMLFLTIEEQFPGLIMPSIGEWYYIQFQDGSMILQDMGEGMPLGVSFPQEDNDTQLWKVTGTDGSYVLESKSGRKIAFENEQFIAAKASTLTFQFNDSQSSAYPASWLLQGNGLEDDTALGSSTTNLFAPIVNNAVTSTKNPVRFIEPNDVDYADYATVPELDEWYYLYFKGSGLIIQYEGDDNKLLTNFPNENNEEAQLWKIVETETPGEFNLVSKAGAQFWYDREAYSDAGRLFASTESATPVKIIPTPHTTLKPAWELEMADITGAYRYMNINGGSNPLNELGLWSNNNESNNVIEFRIASEIDFNANPQLPIISDNNKENWYFIKYKNSGNAIQDNGNNQDLKVRPLDGGLDQAWKITGVQKSYIVTSKNDRAIIYNNEDDVKAFQATDEGRSNMTIQVSENTNLKPALMLYNSETDGYGQLVETAIADSDDKKVTKAMSNTNAAAALEFISVASLPNLPTFSTPEREYWFYIQFKAGDTVLQDAGAESALETTDMDPEGEGQLWKMTGTIAEMVLESNLGNKITFDPETATFKTTAGEGALFSLMIDDDASKGWELKYKFSEDYDNSVKYVLSQNAGITSAEDPHADNNFFTFVATDLILSSLSVSDATLNPAFDPDVKEYTATVDNTIEKVTISAESTYPGAVITGTGEMDLAVGANTATVTLTTGEEGAEVITYTIVITRKDIPKDDATLKALTISNGTLTPVFSPDVLEYAATVGSDVESIEVEAIATDEEGATVEGAGTKTLTDGENLITINVTAEDGTTKLAYKIVVWKSSTSIDGPEAGRVTLAVENSTLTAEFEGTKAIRLYTTTGLVLDQAYATASYSKSLSQGIYILIIDNATYKVLVK